MIKKDLFLANGVLIGTIIGAGIFGIPYVFSRSGWLLSLFYLFFLFFLSLFLNLFFGEIILRTKEKHRLIGYAELYLGKKVRILLILSLILGVGGSLLIYIILSGNFLSIIFPHSLSSFQFAFLVWAILSFFVFLGIRSIASFEFLMNIGLFLAFCLIFVSAFPKIETVNFVFFDKNYLFLPFGIFLFGLLGWNAVPEAEKILKRKQDLKKVIFSSLLTVVIFYFLFGLILSGVGGKATTKEVFQGLAGYLGREVIILGSIFGLLAVTTSFLVLANYLKNTLFFDLKLPYILSFSIAVFGPLTFYILGAREFLSVVAFSGTLVGMIDGIMICLVYRKAKKLGERTPEYSLKIPNIFVYLTILVLILGALTQIIYYFP